MWAHQQTPPPPLILGLHICVLMETQTKLTKNAQFILYIKYIYQFGFILPMQKGTRLK